MLLKVKEVINGEKEYRIEESDAMKLKCNWCVKKKGVAISTDKLYLRTFRGRDYLVCTDCVNLKHFEGEKYERTTTKTNS